MSSMNPKREYAISPRRSEDFPEWYQQVIAAADLAENSEVRGCMIIKPWGYALWERIQKELDLRIKKTGHKNVYFPLFIPLEYLQKEAEHVEGFAKECAVVTHHRLEKGVDGKLHPASPLTEPLVIRPTSETIIGAAFSRWIQSYRDLPLLINQWANVVRWEMRPRLFLRTTEFLWQEGHTVHASPEEARQEALSIVNLYEEFMRGYLALPVIVGEKPESERFPGADNTYTLEAMVQDRKAVQVGTSHFLGQNFSKANNIRFLDKEGKMQFAWTSSWGVSTRLIGTLIMAHGDDNGLVLPPTVSPLQVVILPLVKKEEDKTKILDFAQRLAGEIEKIDFAGEKLRVEVDKREMGGGVKSWEWIKKGVPLRVEIGPQEISSRLLTVKRRDKELKEREQFTFEGFLERLPALLADIQKGIYARAENFLHDNSRFIDSKEEFYAFFSSQEQGKETTGGFAYTYWDGSRETEEKLKEDLKITIRCIPFKQDKEDKGGICPFSGNPSQQRVVFAKAY
ncbi:proline--tRNA ligase [Candidatus Methylacidiphilum infernorum]|uniref:Proline--tRNA ligase n=2 Tax=Candidatus Methylacidiphilum infernorum TaxID=511746 RepID=A0ABX7PX38_9BACT|nr:proline--tRNA ligase [Candidatus Methylacidiphilum infernorum]QSR87228.1 proline--tRNA ligase [Candidatus Methylacidiphilum infernorum]